MDEISEEQSRLNLILEQQIELGEAFDEQNRILYEDMHKFRVDVTAQINENLKKILQHVEVLTIEKCMGCKHREGEVEKLTDTATDQVVNVYGPTISGEAASEIIMDKVTERFRKKEMTILRKTNKIARDITDIKYDQAKKSMVESGLYQLLKSWLQKSTLLSPKYTSAFSASEMANLLMSHSIMLDKRSLYSWKRGCGFSSHLRRCETVLIKDFNCVVEYDPEKTRSLEHLIRKRTRVNARGELNPLKVPRVYHFLKLPEEPDDTVVGGG